MTIKEWLEKHPVQVYAPRMERLKCVDGYSVSVQNGEFNYSDKDSVELGFPNQEDEILEQYKELGEEDATESVYPYVPLKVVDELIAKHGGIA